MTDRAESRFVLALALALATGCGKVFEYPKVQDENGAALCHNDLDDDLNGYTDCDDSNCLGSCSEETPAECSDGRDNDGDGLLDAADPRCWLSTAPTVQRCAKAYGAEVVNHFDAAPLLQGVDKNQGIYQTDWAFWGYDDKRPVVGRARHLGPERRDLLVSFEGNTTGSRTLDQNLGSYVRQFPFSGSLQGFELSFSAYVPPRSMLRAGIVPIELAPSTTAPIAGGENALLSVSLDAFGEPPTLSLVVEGLADASPLSDPVSSPDGEPACDTKTLDCMGRVTVTVDAEGVWARFVDATGAMTEAHSPSPSSLTLPPSRLVLWGGSAEGSPGARLDDLEMNVEPEFPCGFDVPQMPGASCEATWNQGYTVSVARRAEGEHCALVTAADWDVDGQRLAPPRVLGAWSSQTRDDSQAGDDWTLAGVIPLPELGATIVGAGLDVDAQGLHAVFALRNEAAGSVRLWFVDGWSCANWAFPVLGPSLPDDAEAPSYVIARGRHEVYFTRPPVGDERRTLWRVVRGTPAVPPERVAELPLGVEAPVSLQNVGKRDLVLAAPSRAASGGRGVMLFVAEPDVREFRPVGSGPVLRLPPSPDLPNGAGKLGFDDREVISATLSFDEDGGFLLYGGRSTEGMIGSAFGTPVLAAGTARLSLQGEPLEMALVPETRCGNGTCENDEDCVLCAKDCECEGAELLGDVFTPDRPWEFSSDLSAEPRFYVGVNPPAMSFMGGGTTWAALPLDHPVTGDFELSFDAILEAADVPGGLVYVGLGTKATDASDSPVPEGGIFALVGQCYSLFATLPVAVVQGHQARPDQICFDQNSQSLSAWERVVLARRANQVSIRTPNLAWAVSAQDRPICGTAETTVIYAGALPPATHLFIGFGGGAFDGSPVDANPGTISNLTLRSLDDPDHCTELKVRCETDAEAPACVDTSYSPEHCGACGRRCAELETCINGACVCGSYASVPGILECGGACIDPMTSIEHCGGCDHACNKQCSSGLCDLILAGDCASPFAIPPEGGNLALGFPPPVSTEATRFCRSDVLSPLIGTWTPSRSGTADIVVDVGGVEGVDSVVAITDDETCSEWSECNDDIVLYENVSSHLTFSVEANKTYRIGVWLWFFRPLTLQGVELRVGFAP